MVTAPRQALPNAIPGWRPEGRHHVQCAGYATETPRLTAPTSPKALHLSLLVAGAALAVAALSLGVGARPISPGAVLSALGSRPGADATVVLTLRLPRALIGLVVGAALSLAGVLMQVLTRNPLADTGVLGVGNGAAFGVVLTLSVLGITHPAAVAVASVLGALGTLAVVLLVTARRVAGPVHVVLVGTALATLLGAATSLLLLRDAGTLDTVRYWSIGSIAGRDTALALPLLLAILVLLPVVLLLGRRADTLSLGEELARSLGTRVVLVRVTGFAAVAALAGLSTAVAGPIGFLGVLAPHLARRLVGQSAAALLPVSAALGALILIGADVVGRLLAGTEEIEVGLMIAVVGAPVLLAVARSAGVRQL